ncbi:hypothetical protein ACMFMG_002222 [Clarireedia jacksonii]
MPHTFLSLLTLRPLSVRLRLHLREKLTPITSVCTSWDKNLLFLLLLLLLFLIHTPPSTSTHIALSSVLRMLFTGGGFRASSTMMLLLALSGFFFAVGDAFGPEVAAAEEEAEDFDGVEECGGRGSLWRVGR